MSVSVPKDKVKQVIVMRTDLGMRKGKMIAQGAHASMAWMSHLIRQQFIDPYPEIVKATLRTKTDIGVCGTIEDVVLTWEQVEWLRGAFAKVCVRADSEQALLDIYQQAIDAGLTAHLVTDSGLTEFHGVPTKTCIAIGPHASSKIDPITGELALL